MKRPGKKIRRLAAALILGPPLLWCGILALLPMDWARDKVVAALETRTGQRVRLGAVRLRALGGVRLDDLALAAKGSESDPWLKVGTLVVDVSARDLIAGTISPTKAHLAGVKLRIRRDSRGRLEFQDLLATDPTAAPPPIPTTVAPIQDSREMTYRLADATVAIVDEVTDTRLDLTDLMGHGTYDGVVATLDALTGRLNGGAIEMAAKYDRTGGRTELAGQVRAQSVALGVGMKSLAYALPLLAPATDGTSAQGTLTLDLDAKAQGETSEALARSLAGSGSVMLDGLGLDNSRILAEVAPFLPPGSRGKLGSLKGTFEIAKRRVTTEDTVLEVADVPVNLAGWSDFDGRLAYRVKSEDLNKKVHSLAEKLPGEARQLFDELPVERLDGLANLEVSGTLDRPVVRPLEGKFFSRKGRPMADSARRAEDRARLKSAGKKLLDKVILR